MKNGRLQIFSAGSILIGILSLFAISGIAFASGNDVFSPGNLSAKTGAPLGGVTAHNQVQDCAACHASPWSADSMADRCLACHTDISAELNIPESLHSLVRFSQPDLNCLGCHTEHHGPAASLTRMPPGWDPHSQLGFALDAHRLAMDGTPFACADCHPDGYSAPYNQRTCANCHLQVNPVFANEHILTFWTDCLACHDGLDSHGASFDHTQVPFSLTGRHTIVKCGECHIQARNLDNLRAAPQECFACHQKDDLHEGRFGQKCAICHNTDGWQSSAQFDHSLADFDLVGKHIPVACEACHVNHIYRGIPKDCVACHQQDDTHSGELGPDCGACHTPDGWDRAVDHSQFGFPLEGQHANVACESCHPQKSYSNTPTDCFACHAGDDGHAGSLGNRCQDCHTPDGWSPAAPFDHARTAFSLTAHQVRSDGAPFACRDCHIVGYAPPFNQTACTDCHFRENRGFIQTHLVTFGSNCMACHDGLDSFGASWNHGLAPFKLLGQHAQAACSQCHFNDFNLANLRQTPQQCRVCHQKDDFHFGTFSVDCSTCHPPSGWKPANFDHATAPFKLTGKHASVACAACHPDGRYTLTPTSCYACHAADDAHAGQFGLDCAGCHTPDGWELAQVDHSKFAFPLEGQHASAACFACHINGVFKGTPTECYACHQKDDGHAGSLGTQCGQCHTPQAWSPAVFDHNTSRFVLVKHQFQPDGKPFTCVDCHSSGYALPFNQQVCASCHLNLTPDFSEVHILTFWMDCLACHDGVDRYGDFDHTLTPFPVTGKHVRVACYVCHFNARTIPDLTSTPSACYACHQDDDQHDGQFGADCAACHTSDGWELARVDHSKFAFPLVGLHQAVACEACHQNGVFQGTPTDCFACHAADDAHSGALGDDCAACHTPSGWKPANFDHSQSVFPLVGQHAGVACTACHANQAYKGTPTDCFACHALDDVHTGALGANCAACHTPSGWKPANFDHSKSAFPLVGQHTAVQCAACHVNQTYKGTPTDCVACHAADDAHAGALGTQCAVCHTPSGWKPANFDHSKSAFPLVGQHTAVQCAACHVNQTYKGTPTDCFACHAADDAHVGALGTQCAVCHTPSGWKPANFDHSKSVFPLTGKHTGVTCENCHVGGVYKGTPTDCASCHSDTDPHGGALGAACANCHTTSGWTPSTFNHANSIFPLTGKHTTASCSKCHTDLRYKGTPTTCYACHAANDRHGGKYGTNCAVCHTTTAWKPSTFDHRLTAFPLTGTHITTSCELCHPGGVFKGTPTQCVACHADPAYHIGLFGTDCAACHTTTAWRPAVFTQPHTFPMTHGKADACKDCHTTTLSAYTCFTCHDQAEMTKKHTEKGIADFSDCMRCHPTGKND